MKIIPSIHPVGSAEFWADHIAVAAPDAYRHRGEPHVDVYARLWAEHQDRVARREALDVSDAKPGVPLEEQVP